MRGWSCNTVKDILRQAGALYQGRYDKQAPSSAPVSSHIAKRLSLSALIARVCGFSGMQVEVTGCPMSE